MMTNELQLKKRIVINGVFCETVADISCNSYGVITAAEDHK